MTLSSSGTRNYLRLSGEEHRRCAIGLILHELSPPERRRVAAHPDPDGEPGIISA